MVSIAEQVAKAINCQNLFFSFSQLWVVEWEVLAVNFYNFFLFRKVSIAEWVAKAVSCQNIFFFHLARHGLLSGNCWQLSARTFLHLDTRALLSSWLMQSTARTYFFI
jgi:hypothetical protein